MLPIFILIGIAIVLQVLGFVWYGPIFGKKYGALINMPAPSQMTSEANKAFHKRMIPTYIINFVLSLVTIFVYLIFVQVLGAPMMVALLVWLGFVMPIEAGVAMWSGKPRKQAWQLFGITAGYQLLAFVVTALLTLWWLM